LWVAVIRFSQCNFHFGPFVRYEARYQLRFLKPDSIAQTGSEGGSAGERSSSVHDYSFNCYVSRRHVAIARDSMAMTIEDDSRHEMYDVWFRRCWHWKFILYWFTLKPIIAFLSWNWRKALYLLLFEEASFIFCPHSIQVVHIVRLTRIVLKCVAFALFDLIYFISLSWI